MQIIAATVTKLPQGVELDTFISQLRREVDHIAMNPEAHDTGDVQKYAKNVERLTNQPMPTVTRGHLVRLADDLAVASMMQVI